MKEKDKNGFPEFMEMNSLVWKKIKKCGDVVVHFEPNIEKYTG